MKPTDAKTVHFLLDENKFDNYLYSDMHGREVCM